MTIVCNENSESRIKEEPRINDYMKQLFEIIKFLFLIYMNFWIILDLNVKEEDPPMVQSRRGYRGRGEPLPLPRVGNNQFWHSPPPPPPPHTHTHTEMTSKKHYFWLKMSKSWKFQSKIWIFPLINRSKFAIFFCLKWPFRKENFEKWNVHFLDPG